MNVLVSACLLGANCRYDGGGALHPALEALAKRPDVVLIPVCPEIYGGLATPRTPAERQGAAVMTKDGQDVTAAYEKGAQESLRLAQLTGCTAAVLKARSPSCGSGRIYDGNFNGTQIPGDGVTAALLKANGIAVYTEEQVEQMLEEH